MHILIISDHADPLARIGSKEAGGQNIFIFYLARFLCKLGVNVDVYTRWDKKNKREVIKYNSHLRIIRVKAGPRRYMPRDNFLNVVDEFAVNVLRRISRENIDYDVIHTNYWYSGLIGLKIAKKIKKPIVHVYHSIGQIRFNSLKELKEHEKENEFFEKRIKAEKEIAYRVDRIIATSDVEKDIVSRLFGISKKKIDVITIGVDKKVFRPIKKERARKLIKMNLQEKVILYVGRIEWRKGVGTLIYSLRDVAKNNSEARLYIVGGGKSKSDKSLEAAETVRLLNMVKELGLENRICFLGSKKQKELYKYYSAADVCVVPSYYEPFGIVPIESMACGTPVVVSRTGGLQYTVLDGKTGYLVNPKDFKTLAKKINLVLKKGKNFYKDNCLERIEYNFNWTIISEEYKKYFNNLTKK